MSKGFKYIFIGNPINLQEIGHFAEKGISKRILNEAHQIFTKFCSSGDKTKDERHNIKAKGNGIYYFTISSQNIFLMALTEKNVTERKSFELLYNIQNKIIKENNKELNTVGKHQIKLVEGNFNENNNGKEKIEQINNEINDAKIIIENEENIIQLIELGTKAEESAKEFEKIIVLSDLEIIDKDRLTDYFCNKPNNEYYYYSDEEKPKTEEEKKEIIEKKNKLINQSSKLYHKIDNQKIKELESAFNQITLKIKLDGKPKILKDGIFYTSSNGSFKMYDSKFFNKLLEINLDSSIISAIQLDNDDLIFACTYGEILIYRLKEKQYFEYQKIIEDGFGFNSKYGNHGFCGNTAYKIEYKINNLKKISGNRFICISNYGIKIYSLNKNNEYSLVLLNEHLNDIKIIHEINSNNFIFCTKRNLDDTYIKDNKIKIELVELKKVTKKELDNKLVKLNKYGYHLKNRRFDMFMFDDKINENDKNIYKDKLQKFIKLLKLSCSFNEIIEFKEYANNYHLSSYIIIKKKYFIVLINNNIFIIDIINGKLLKRYEILINLILNGNDSLFIYTYMNIQKWNNSEDNEFIIFIEKNIILFELNEDENNIINLKILNKSYFPNIENESIFQNISEKINKFYSYKITYNMDRYFRWRNFESKNENENIISIY